MGFLHERYESLFRNNIKTQPTQSIYVDYKRHAVNLQGTKF